jgi:hypothetical protein
VERTAVPVEEYSPLQMRLMEQSGLTPSQLNTPRLIAHLKERKGYVVHGKVLGYYLRKGMRVSRFECGIRFRQEAWLKPYISDLMEERRRAQHQFEVASYKQMSNSAYGQLLRNPRHDRSVELVRTRRRFRKLVAQPTFKSFTIHGEDLVAVERSPSKIMMDNLVAAGASVLDFSKQTMNELYWKFKDQFKERMTTLMSDTDSFGLEITSEDLVGELASLSSILDTSGLPSDHPLYSKERERVPGLLKLEYATSHILRFAGIRPKVYCLDLEEHDKKKKKQIYKCKGVQKGALARSVTFEDYKRCIFEDTVKRVTFASIRTDGQHRIYTMEQTKAALRNFDNKRYLQDDGINTRAFGYNPLDEEDEIMAELEDTLWDLLQEQ